MKAHGEFDIYHDGDVLLTRVTGAWNREGTAEYCASVRAAVRRLKQPWGQIVDARGWMLAVPDAGIELAALSKWRDTHGLACIAYLDHDNGMMREFAQRNILSKQSTAVGAIFDDAGSLVDWMSGQGFPLSEALNNHLKTGYG